MMKQQGFTLIELMIVVLTLAILVTIAYPTYDTYIRRSRIENVRADLMANAQMLERYYVQHHTFKTFPDDSVLKQNDYFTITLDEKTDSQFKLTATPNSSNRGEDRVVHLNDSNIMTVCKQGTENCSLFN